jgi:hypothetical protein
MQRVPGAKVTAHVGRIEEKTNSFYDYFTILILGLDSIEARRYMNGVACSFLGTLLTTLLLRVVRHTVAPRIDCRHSERQLL